MAMGKPGALFVRWLSLRGIPSPKKEKRTPLGNRARAKDAPTGDTSALGAGALPLGHLPSDGLCGDPRTRQRGPAGRALALAATCGRAGWGDPGLAAAQGGNC